MNGYVERWDARAQAVRVRTDTGRWVAVWPYTDINLGSATYYPLRAGYVTETLKYAGTELPHVTLYLDAPKVPGAALQSSELFSPLTFLKSCEIVSSSFNFQQLFVPSKNTHSHNTIVKRPRTRSILPKRVELRKKQQKSPGRSPRTGEKRDLCRKRRLTPSPKSFDLGCFSPKNTETKGS